VKEGINDLQGTQVIKAVGLCVQELSSGEGESEATKTTGAQRSPAFEEGEIRGRETRDVRLRKKSNLSNQTVQGEGTILLVETAGRTWDPWACTGTKGFWVAGKGAATKKNETTVTARSINEKEKTQQKRLFL